MKATAKDIRFFSKEILETVSRGEEVVIRYRGKPHSKIVPIITEKKAEKIRPELFGIWKDYDAVENVDKFVRDKRKGRIHDN